MTRRRRRSTRSYVLEFALAVVAIGAIWVFLLNGGPAAVGGWIGPMFAAPS